MGDDGDEIRRKVLLTDAGIVREIRPLFQKSGL